MVAFFLSTRSRLPCVAAVLGVLVSPACQGSSGTGPAASAAEPALKVDAAKPPADSASRAGPASPPSPTLTTFPAVDLTRLDPAARNFFVKVANEEVCPCDCPKSFGQCLQEGTSCTPAVVLAEWIVKNLESGVPPESLQESITRELTAGFAGPMRSPAVEGFATKGPAQAKHTIVEYADFECGHCRAAAAVVDELVKARSDVRVIYKHYPLPFHPMARTAAIAAEAAGRQGKFWEMHKAIFATQEHLTEDLLKGHARALGLDAARFDKDFVDPELATKVDGSRTEGQSFGIEFTPYFLVDGRPFFLARSLEGLDVRFRMEEARRTSSCQ